MQYGSLMLKKVIILTLLTLLITTQNAMAGFWEDVAQCFTDPCNCGLNPKDRYEYHNGSLIRQVKKDYVCPPWNKDGGRDNDTCLLLKHYPYTPTGVYENLCAEEAPDSTYFNPKIRVRGQQCNVFACWTTDNTLNWNGDCVTLASGYGAFPLHRMCARIALPKDDAKNFAEDPGYTKGVHLNSRGLTIADDLIIGNDGTPIAHEFPKLCLYRDPSFLSVGQSVDADFMDLDPNRQPMQKTSKVHPVVEIIVFFLSISTETGSSISEMISQLFNLLNGDSQGETTFNSIMRDLFSFIGDIISWVGGAMQGFLQEVGQINRVVDNTSYGCVNIPMGPYPPPFCKQAAPIFQVAEVQNICVNGNNGFPVSSVANAECHVSTIQNNYIRNSIRVGYEDLLPLCKNGENPNTTDKCVRIDNLGAFSSATGLHTATARRDIIKHCSNAVAGAPCVESMISHSCSVSAHGCGDGFRVVYGQNLGGVVTPVPYYRDDIPDCPSSGSAMCQEIWGINIGEFADISVTFPKEQESFDILPVSHNFSLVDKNDRTASFSASIVRVANFDPVFDFTQSPKQICVFEGEFVVGCLDRASIFRPKIYECANSPNPNISCISSYFAPEFIVSYESGNDSTTAVIEPESVYNPGGINNKINLAGDSFESFVTDDSFAVKPFSGPNSPNPSSLYGKYQDNIALISGQTINEDAVYMEGLEYINGKYHLGGKYACLSTTDIVKCPQNPKMCVLAKLLNSDLVACSTFFSKSIDHGGISLCRADQTATCTVIDLLPRKMGGTVPIRSCPGNIKCYDGTKELCQISQVTSDRINPLPSLGTTLSDNQYYDTVTAGPYPNSPLGNAANYDQETQGIRDKTPLELGLCVSVPQGVCPSENTPNIDTGYATWPSGELEQNVIGTCAIHRTPKNSQSDLVRKCIANSDTQSFNLEPIYRIKRDPPANAPYKTYPTNIECVPIKCPGETNPTVDTGYATWPGADYGNYSSGTCAFGRVPSTSASDLMRRCIQDPVTKEYKLEPVPGNVKCIAVCAAETIANANTGYATWTSVELGEFSVGTCASGRVPAKTSSDLSRECIFDSLTNQYKLEPISGDARCIGNCPAVTTASASTGYATWSAAKEGENSSGTCMSGTAPKNSASELVRNCKFDATTNDYKLESISGNAQCVPICQAETTASAQTGYATWSSVKAGEYSTGTCMSGTIPLNVFGNPVRQCILDPSTNQYKLEKITLTEVNLIFTVILWPNIGCTPGL
jgi:hypothetical protein